MSDFLSQKQAMEYLNISRMTLLRWEEKGIIKPAKTVGNHRRYSKVALERLLGINENNSVNTDSKKCLVYARVSTKKQEDAGNLQRQLNRISHFATQKDWEIVHSYQEVASGINENRKFLKLLMNKVQKEKIDYLVIEYKDRLAIFGYEYLEDFFESHGVEIITVENQEEKSMNEEMVEDMIAIITSFSARLYGQRGSKQIKKQMETLSKENV